MHPHNNRHRYRQRNYESTAGDRPEDNLGGNREDNPGNSSGADLTDNEGDNQGNSLDNDFDGNLDVDLDSGLDPFVGIAIQEAEQTFFNKSGWVIFVAESNRITNSWYLSDLADAAALCNRLLDNKNTPRPAGKTGVPPIPAPRDQPSPRSRRMLTGNSTGNTWAAAHAPRRNKTRFRDHAVYFALYSDGMLYNPESVESDISRAMVRMEVHRRYSAGPE